MSSLRPIFCLVFVAAMLSACAPSPRPVTPPPPAAVAETVPQTADEAVSLARRASGEKRHTLLLRGAELYLDDNQSDKAQLLLNDIQKERMSGNTQNLVRILSARIALLQNQPREALDLLVFTDILPAAQQKTVAELRARAFMDAGFPFDSVKSRVQLDSMISDDAERQRNHQAIWQALSMLPATSLNQISEASLHPQLMGWVELAKIAKRSQVDWQYLQKGLNDWRRRYPDHPAAAVFIAELGLKQTELLERPKHIAVLLPLSGRYAAIAAAIRDGLMAAYYRHPDTSFRPELHFIDTGDNATAILNHYKAATDLGADFIVGPFLKSEVNTLAQSDALSTPILTLNYAEQTPTEPDEDNRFYQFGLLPEDEARQAAEMAYSRGNTRAAALAPEGEWGQRLLAAFKQRFEELGGTVISSRSYTPGNNDFKQPIQSLLNLDASHARHSKVQRLARIKLEFTPYRRQDVDMIFLAATPRDARLLKPQLKFHYAGELPVYATSHVFTGKIDRTADHDIDDVLYIDMPWILSDTPLKKSLNQLWPEQEQYSRFFALGSDAYNLIPYLGRLRTESYERFSGQTGNIYIDPFNRLHRELLLARFVNGAPRLIDLNNPETHDAPVNTDDTE
jgi:outer membrane PBP1 activator LpoA protein